MMLHCAYTASGLPVLPQSSYEYNDEVQNNHNGHNSHHPSMNVDLNNLHPHQSPHSNAASLNHPRTASGHSTILHSTAPINACHAPQFPFNHVPLPHSPYQHGFDSSSGQYYPRPVHPGYISSPGAQAMPGTAGLPYISKAHHMASSSRRSNPATPSTELVPLTNRLRVEDSSGNPLPGPSTSGPLQSDLSDGPEPPLSLEASNGGPASSTAFISKLYHLCSHEDYRSYIRWNSPGDAFVLAHANTDFARQVLPRFFRHNNVSSFIRQLNLYNFTRLPTIKLLDTIDSTHNQSPASAFSGFSHPHFRRGDEGSLRYIKPKANKNKSIRKAAKCAGLLEDREGKPGRSLSVKPKI